LTKNYSTIWQLLCVSAVAYRYGGLLIFCKPTCEYIDIVVSLLVKDVFFFKIAIKILVIKTYYMVFSTYLFMDTPIPVYILKKKNAIVSAI